RSLHQYDVLVRKVTGEAGSGTDELPARAIERGEPLGHGTVLDAMDDAQHLHLATLPMGEGAIVVECGERVIHALQPLCRLIGARHAGEGQGEREQADSFATSDSGSHCLARGELAGPTPRACWRFPAHSPSARRADSPG